MRYGLMPKGPVRRAVVFGGWNFHIFNPDIVDGRLDVDAATRVHRLLDRPGMVDEAEWNSSNPGNLRGFRTKWMKERLDTIKFLNVTTSMLPGGIPFPVIPESTEIMNIIVPDMLQNVLTQKMSVETAADDAANKLEDIISPI